jgi:hypothetical protein
LIVWPYSSGSCVPAQGIVVRQNTTLRIDRRAWAAAALLGAVSWVAATKVGPAAVGVLFLLMVAGAVVGTVWMSWLDARVSELRISLHRCAGSVGARPLVRRYDVRWAEVDRIDATGTWLALVLRDGTRIETDIGGPPRELRALAAACRPLLHEASDETVRAEALSALARLTGAVHR